jgi:hypothetical protein
LIKNIVLTLLLISIQTVNGKQLLQGGFSVDNQCRFFVTNKHTLKITDRNLNSFKTFENTVMFDCSGNGTIAVFSKKQCTILNKKLETILSFTIKLHPYWNYLTKCVELPLIKNNLLIVPSKKPFLINLTTKQRYNLPSLFSFYNNTIYFHTFKDIIEMKGILAFTDNGYICMFNSNTQYFAKLFVNGNKCTKITKGERFVTVETDNKYSHTIDIKRKKIISTTKIKNRDKSSISISAFLGTEKKRYKIRIKSLNTSVFSALNAWEQGKGEGEITVSIGEKVNARYKFTFSIKQMNKLNFDMEKHNTFVVVKLPEKDIVITKNKNITFTEIDNTQGNYCVCNNQIYTLNKEKIIPLIKNKQ